MAPDVEPPVAIQFACDAMLGGLARWLRAAGYDASWHPGIADRELVRLGRDRGRVILSSDSDIFAFSVVRDGVIRTLFVPRELNVQRQLAHVLRAFRLPLKEPRCMACGGLLTELSRDMAAGRVPPKSLTWHDCFWECLGCGKVFWHGTHWARIVEQLRAVDVQGAGDASS
jgi:uncharacterized protein with PIN domain